MADTAKINGEQSWLDAPAFDPSAEFQVAGSGRQNNVPEISTLAAAGLGAASGATANFADEIYGVAQASGLPVWLRGLPFGLPYTVGGARLLYENTIGTPGEATRNYQAGRDYVRQLQKAAYEQHPRAYMTGVVGGAVATAPLPGLQVVKGVGAGARLVNGLANTAATGGLYGAGDGEGAKDTFAKAATGVGAATVGGLLAAPVTAASSQGGGRLVPRVVGAVAPRVFNALDPGGTQRMGIFAPADEPAPEPAWTDIP
jgi:hypothetical protein